MPLEVGRVHENTWEELSCSVYACYTTSSKNMRSLFVVWVEIVSLPMVTRGPSVTSFQVIGSPDHVGYWTMLELLHQIGGTILPSETLVQCLSHHRAHLGHGFPEDLSSPVPQTLPWTSLLPLDSTLNCLFSKPSVFQAAFPKQEGTLFLSTPGNFL